MPEERSDPGSGGSGGSVYADLDRPPLSVAVLRRALVQPEQPWSDVRVVARTGSTQRDLVDEVSRGRTGAGVVLVAEEQVQGRGRLERRWTSPPRAGLTFSVVLAPAAPVAAWGWLPLLAGLAVRDAIGDVCALDVDLKWPNDVLDRSGRKIAGIIAERVDLAGRPGAVVGVGLNVSTRVHELPVETASSIQLAGGDPLDRSTILVAVLRSLAGRLATWRGDGATQDSLRSDYRAACATIGADVRVLRTGADTLVGRATGVDDDGRLVVPPREPGAPGGTLPPVALAAGDVEHVRSPSG